MTNISKVKLVLLTAVLVLCDTAYSIAAPADSSWLVSPELLRAGKLEILWQNKLPMKESENLERLFILGNRIYALSDQNYFVSLNREKGSVIFSKPVAPDGFPVVGLELYNGWLFSIIGNKLVEIDPEFGVEHSSRLLDFGVTYPAARNNSYFYIAGTDRRLHALRADDKVQVFEAAADNESMITSVIADDRFVIFATDAGNCICITPDGPKRLWQFDAADGIAGTIVADADSLFFASKDTNVYVLDILTGELIWKYQTQAILERGPRVSKEVVYQYVNGKGLAAIDRETGTLIWQLAKGIDLLAEADGKAYVMTDKAVLAVMDNIKAKQLYCINFARVSKYVTNVVDSKIYIADHAGLIACVKPIE